MACEYQGLEYQNANESMPKNLAWLTKRTPNIIHTMKTQNCIHPFENS
jgi:hypothetical protein